MADHTIWLNFVNNRIITEKLNKNIIDSWLLAKQNNIQFNGQFVDVIMRRSSLSKLLRVNQQYLNLINKYMENIAKGIQEECNYTIFLVNADGFLLKKIGNFKEEINQQLGLIEGACWCNGERGTTATGIALKYLEPNGVKGFEHYQNRYHEYMSIGLPIFNTEGQLIYVLSLLIPHGPWPRIIDALMMTAVQGIEGEIFHHEYKQKIEKLNHDLVRKNNLYCVQTNMINYIFDNVSDMVFTMDKDKYFVKVNRSAKKFLKRSYGAKKLDDVYDNLLITDFSGQRILIDQDPVYMVFNGQKSINAEICIHWGDSQKEYYYMDAMPFKDDEGKDFAIGILKNITDYLNLKDLNNQFQKKAEELENIINTVSEGVAIIDPSGEYKLVNSACDEIFQYRDKIKTDELKLGVVLKYGEVTQLDGTPITHEEFPTLKVLQGKTIKDQMYKVKLDEQIKYVSFSGIPVFNKTGKLDYAVMSFSDVTKIQLQKIKISQQKQFIEAIIGDLGAPVAAVSYPHGRFELANEGYLTFLQQIMGIKLNEEDLIGKTFHEVLPVFYADDFMEVLKKVVVRNKTTEPKIVEYVDFHGGERHYQIVHSPTVDENNKIMYVTAVGVEVTEQIKAKKEVEALAKMKAEYFTVISHELRSPISVVHSAIQMLNSDVYEKEFSGRTLKMLNRIEKNTNRLLDLVNNFLDITKAEAGYMQLNNSDVEILSFSETLVESLQPVAMKKSIYLKLINNCSTSVIRVDIEKYERILLNLLSNAIKFTDNNGEVILYLSENDNDFIVKVKDNGIGIPAHCIDKVFDHFYIVDGSLSRRNNGTGIGLSLVKKLVELMKGRIIVKSVVDEGSEFILYLPKNN